MSAAKRSTSMVGGLMKGAVGGIVGGLVFIVVNMWFVASTGGQALGPLRLISTLVLGGSALSDGSANAWIGAVVHAVLSVVFGVTLAVVAMRLRSNAAVTIVSTLFGAALFVVNFLILSPLFFEAFQAPNKAFEFAVHIVFGTLAGFFLLRPEGAADRDQSVAAEHRR